MQGRLFAYGIAGLVLLAGCASSPGAAPTSDGGTDAGGASTTVPNSGGEGESDGESGCATGCIGTAEPGAVCVVSVDARLLDTAGAAAVGEPFTVCGTNICSAPAMTDAHGMVHFSLCINMVEPALRFVGESSYVSFAAAVRQSTVTFPPATLVPLSPQGAPIPTSGGSISAGSITLQVAAASVSFDPTQPPDPDSREFRAAAIDRTQAPPGLDPTLDVKGLWGLAPINALLSPSGTLTVPNPDPSWGPGTTIDFVENGMDESTGAPVPYGGWGHIGTGTVSQDGKTITTDTGTGNGLPILGIVGVFPHT
jgi:hypothetical protein